MVTQDPSSACAEPPCKYTSVAKDEIGQPKQWKPFFLRRSTIVCFLCLFLSVSATLIALYVYSERKGQSLGIVTDGDKYYYLWTYGPTAVFTILTAGWSQIEYRAVQLMPWILMRRGPTPSSESIFLDYISQWNVISFFKSIKKRHSLVSLCVGGSLLLHGATVFSTALFELRSVPISYQTSFSVPQKFSDAQFDEAIGREITYSACSAFTNNNLTRPFGLHETFVYTPFYPADSYATGNTTLPAGPHYKAEIELIEPLLECQVATATWDTDIKVGTDDDSITKTYTERNTTLLSSDECHFKMEPYDVFADLVVGNDTVSIEIYIGGCNGERPDDEPYARPARHDWRIWATVINPIIANSSTDHQNTKPYDDIGNSVLTSAWPTPPFHAVMCNPRFNAYRGPVSMWHQPGDNAISADITRERLETSQRFDKLLGRRILLSAFRSLRLGSPNSDTSLRWSGTRMEYDRIRMPDFEFMGQPNISSKVYWDDMSLLIKGLQDDFACMMRQTIMSELLEPELENIRGVAEVIEKRLFVRALSFALMLGLLVCLIAICIALLSFFFPVTASTGDTSSILGMTSVFAQSPEFMTLFDGSNFKTESQMAESDLGQTGYSSLETEGTLKILCHENLMPDRNPSQETEKVSPTWWYPLSSTWPIRVLVVAIPIIVIIALEIVQHISTNSRGIAFIGDRSSFIHYVWIYIPALVMFTIRCLFTCVEFGARIVQPYSVLREGNASPETTIKENQLRKIAIYGLFDTLLKKQWALAAATASLFLAAILPVVVSGLYTVQASWPTSPIEIVQSSRWNLGDPVRAREGSDMQWVHDLWSEEPEAQSDKIAGLIIHLNLTFPQWTHNNLAFPGFSLVDFAEIQKAGYIDIRVPALRSKLNCVEFQPDCEIALGDGTQSINCYSNHTLARYGTIDPSTPYSYQCLNNNEVFYGKWNKNFEQTEYHWFHCDATLEEVDVETRLRIPSLSIDSDSPTSVVPNSNRTILRTGSWTLPYLCDIQTELIGKYPEWDSVMLEALVNGTGGVSAEELLNPKVMAERTDTIWGIVMAQLLVQHAKEDFQGPLNTDLVIHPATNEAPRYKGVFFDGRDYLVQNVVSTRILDGLLGGMVLCAVIALFSMRTKDVLPKSPCSIASVASFVAGSKFLETMKDTGMQERDWSEISFSMGWWKVEREEKSNSSTRSTSISSILSDNRENTEEAEGNESGEENETTNTHSVHSSGDSSSTSARRHEEIEENISNFTAGSHAEETPRSRSRSLSVHSGAEGSRLSGNREASLEAGDAQTRFGIDIDGYRPLLDDVE